jgi:starch synthase (maltosyl-transferring)
MSALETIVATLRERRRDLAEDYYVPGLWIDHDSTAPEAVNPYDFYAEKLQSILAGEPVPLVQGAGGGEWSRHAIVYNLFPRVTTAYDHAHDAKLALEPSADGWRDTGTLLKCTALLPFIQSLGINTVYLLPITSVGQDGKKGTLGSPYAIRNPYRLDDRLTEPALGLDVDTLFAGFVEAAHRLGLRVVMEFVLRTASKDADWIGDHPEWFYWIREDVPDRQPGSADPAAYGTPVFPVEDLVVLKNKVGLSDFSELPPPPKVFREMFTPPPRVDQVFMDNGRWLGVLDDGTRVRIPGAFSDWPPDDNQPPWSDVTYLRLYEHPDFNYMAYNTIRMYDAQFARSEQAVHALWDAIVGVIPHYQQTFGIDGVLLDMGHALPMPLKKRLVETARAINPDFAFWEENFLIEQHSVDQGYNAVVGYLLFDFHAPEKLRQFLNLLADVRLPLPFFATAENHNTPRAYSRPSPLAYVHYVLALSTMLPGIPFIHSGFELMETQPVNTGLGFSHEMLRMYSSAKLPLFSEWAFDWTRPDNLVSSIRYALGVRRDHAALLSDPDPATFFMGYGDNAQFVVFARQDETQTLVAVANTNMRGRELGRAFLPICEHQLAPVWGTEVAHRGNGTISVEASLGDGHVLILEGGAEFPRLCKLGW